ncbi:SDR family oxidoreductase [Flavilitoribacter nigricans]|uniref:D-mannonate oxidoreductase n=1 Tax=Flavilitoribacter nigricans (strain ATCC 23147 / DSM 23189 / NBRC 102662 / NCIMB 1420 / SS-2) TaxID=1122177 RepID=A0A2D0NIV3_FLAN2|nr:SDR family oxidoreductase [Flavilitoribacter nigricans]PHN07683.1 D-mannonate oxidoreductase [Flavilitoribacter nigricans DSM 23189 = NBRC 102662]
MNSFDLQDKVAVITGGAGVLGGTMADSLAKAGVKVAILGRTARKVNDKVNELREAGGQAMALVANVLDQQELEAACRQLEAEWGALHILINAAGGNVPEATIGPDMHPFDLPIEAFDRVNSLNLQGTVLPTLVFGPLMAKTQNASIINISSMASFQAITRVVAYSTGKAGIDAFTRWMAVELARRHGNQIRVNAVAPGFFIADQNRRLLLQEDGSLTQRGKTIIDNTPMGRFGEAEELCGIIHWLSSEASSFVTGAVIPVDGGFSAFSGV